uniref:Uncharacterized protein n=1 Tax=Caenorhabditis japonica TaxID=281687 RepID=A0A8R1EDE6_CAEJA
MSSSSISLDSNVLAPVENCESKTPEVAIGDVYRLVVEMSKSLAQVTLQNKELVQMNGELMKKVESLELIVKELKVDRFPSKKSFAQVVTAGLKSSAAQVSLIKAAEIANDAEKRNAAVVLDKVELPENSSSDGQFGQEVLKACEVQDKCRRKKMPEKSCHGFNKVKSNIQGCSTAVIRPDLSQPEREKHRAAWKEAVMKNNKAGKFEFTVRKLECVKVHYKEGEVYRPWEVRETRKSNVQ